MNEKLKEIEVLENQVEEITNQLEDVSDNIKETLKAVPEKSLVAYRLKSLMGTIEKANDLMINDIQWFRKPRKSNKIANEQRG